MKVANGAIFTARLVRQDESMAPALRALAISYCLHIVFRTPLRGVIGTMV